MVMALSAEEVRKIARLARLRLSAEEERTFAPQLAEILAYVEQLDAFETAEATEQGSDGLERDDIVGESVERSRFLANAPRSWGSFLLVPQVKASGDE